MGQFSWRFVVWFCVLLLALAFFTIMSVTMVIRAHAATDIQTPQTIDIQDDHGGNVLEYYKNFETMSERGTVIRLHGACISSCTMVLFRQYTGIKVCAAAADAVFAFHKPFFFDKKHNIVKTKTAVRASRAIWAEWLVSYPYDIYNLLKDAHIPSATEGENPSDLFVVPAIFFVPRCEAAQ